MSATQKVAARRRRAPGELYVAQTGDLAAIEALLAQAGESAGITAGGLDAPGGCWIGASIGDAGDGAGIALVGVIGMETIVDTAVIRSLAVAEAMRRRGIGAALVGAARKAAHTRGARRLYALGRRGQDSIVRDYLLRFGFEPVARRAMLEDLDGTFIASYLRVHPEQLARIDALLLDISRDGVIER
ncbi:MAG TPA: GNAT family N-acetyltransferase [Candidatus Binataceae bacterium]